jgi:exodeoxyribonuclease VII large subunit
MPPKVKSQWEFSGELFPSQEMRRVFSVTEINGTVRRLIEERLGTVWVTGEVSNRRLQSSGHIYFSLKDAGAQLGCVCFRDDARASRDLLQDGHKVVVKGELTLYEGRGQFQLLVKAVELEGAGALQAAFEKLKQKLNAQGLFDPKRKRPLPPIVRRIAVVTSLTGAALRDVCHVIARRDPTVSVIVAGCRVQGQGSAEEMVRAIARIHEWAARGNAIDAILLTRGGGSLEDLWSFNEEVVAHAVFQSRIPVVSAVGHEIDFTISDFVADIRAATPSAGAELLTEGMFRRREWIAGAGMRLLDLARASIASTGECLERVLARRIRAHPRRALNVRWQRLDELQNCLHRCARNEMRREQTVLVNLAQRLIRLRPSRTLLLRRQLLTDMSRRLRENTLHAFALHEQRWRVAMTRLRLLSPQQVLERGFSITRDAETGRILRDAKEIRNKQRVKTTLCNGEFISVADHEKTP